MIAEQIGDSGEIAILSASANALLPKCVDRADEEGVGQPPQHQVGGHGVRQ